MGWLGRQSSNATGERPRPDPEELYPSRLRALMPQPTEQVGSSLAVKLVRAEKQALDLLAAWPLCTTEQLMGLMAGVTRRRANQVIRSLTDLALIRAEGKSHVLTDEGLTWLARRDRASVGQVLDRWTAEPSVINPRVYAGTALRSVASQPDHHGALTTMAATLTTEGARSKEYGVLDLLSTSRSAVGYWHDDTNYVVHPDISFTLDLPGGYRHCFMECERRATTPRRVRARLEDYRRYFRSDTPAGTTAGSCPWCCSSSRPPTTRTPSWTAPATSTTPPSPAPTWRPSPNTASWLARGYRPPRNPGKGCHCSDWSRCHSSSKAVPRVSCREATNKRE